MTQAYTKAFEVWENEFRAHPEQFMTAEEIAAAEVLTISERRAVYFDAILRKLEAGQTERAAAVTHDMAIRPADLVNRRDG